MHIFCFGGMSKYFKRQWQFFFNVNNVKGKGGGGGVSTLSLILTVTHIIKAIQYFINNDLDD